MTETLSWDKVEEVALALLGLSMHAATRDEHKVWKALDWSITERLHERGWISDPRCKARSVKLTEEGAINGKAFLDKHFAEE